MYNNRKTAAIIAAAGSGRRMESLVPKQYLTLCGKTVLERAIEAFNDNAFVDEILIVAGEPYLEYCYKNYVNNSRFLKVTQTVCGGLERQDSVYAALKALSKDVEYVLIHDGARPFITQRVINRVLKLTEQHGAAVAAVSVKDTIKTAGEDVFRATLNREELRAVQTPQGFHRQLLMEAYAAAYGDCYYSTDDAGLVERMGHKVYIAEGEYSNIKITTREDLAFGEALLGTSKASETLRIGTGYDVHQLVEGRACILGGVEIPFERGLLGHSDADVLLHAVMDALLGAAALGDIGAFFPDTEERYRGAASMELLCRVEGILKEAGYRVGNVDATVIAQKPKLAPYISEMRENIASALGIEKDRVNIKGTTTEKLGFCGREEGIAAEAVALLIEEKE